MKNDGYGSYNGKDYDILNQEKTIDDYLYSIKANLLMANERVKVLKNENMALKAKNVELEKKITELQDERQRDYM